MDSTRGDLLRMVLETHRNEYTELSETWRTLDTKAQGLGALAGIFLAAAFAWARDLPKVASLLDRSVVIGTIVLLVLAVVGAVRALQVRAVAPSPFGSETEDMLRDILAKSKESELPERVLAFNNDQITLWKDTNKEVRRFNDDKADWISFGQYMLLSAAALVALFSSLTVAFK